MFYNLQGASPFDASTYLISSRPFLSSSFAVPISGTTAGSVLKITLPKVSKFIMVKNETSTGGSSAPIRVAFTDAGCRGLTAPNYFKIGNGEAISADWAVKEVYLMGDGAVAPTASIVAGLTQADTFNLPDFTAGSGV